ncbi:3-phosphoshikimate 1-carboxyvinyltransferase [Haliangium ochraceum]|uniref:3-phosphoshikimate 1-carboxyvinyltransferase n=1 Tax=Haliangium ochraceum (strain DSM 14365 / JCM 11303 / SMP-2) TaxID=502025 RepID=D0LX36_HALO1|nr:3-phosphoshikimate 1-carboxyvinyltransferase [Haliangium ochraceum]ACY16078.1 3-phosphoshikimate 1-carboxyvinyltransferase [Haliangium ochraceum DSM 14365]
MSAFIVEPARSPLIGHATVPGDKSISHRALLLGALCRGKVVVRGLGSGEDNLCTAHAVHAMGAQVSGLDALAAAPSPDREIAVSGVGLRGLRAPAGDIDCGNAGTAMRLLCGLLAPQSFASVLVGDASLHARPMRRVIDPLSEMGARITGAEGKKPGEIYPPLRIAAASGPMTALDYAMPVASAQVKSAVLLCGLYADGVTRVSEPGAARDHSERMLAHMGAPIRWGGGEITLDTKGWDGALDAELIEVPADPSQAAFVLAAALIVGVERVTVGRVCINDTRTGFLDVLAAMNGRIEREAMQRGGPEPVADLSVSRGAGDALQGTEIAGELVVRAVDELPILAVVAARANGVTHVRDAGELRVKESDRIATTCAMLRALGCEVEERPDGFSVVGMPGRPFQSARIDAAGDHRIAMAGAVAGLCAEGPVRVDDVACVDTSFPGFAEVLGKLGAQVKVVAE